MLYLVARPQANRSDQGQTSDILTPILSVHCSCDETWQLTLMDCSSLTTFAMGGENYDS